MMKITMQSSEVSHEKKARSNKGGYSSRRQALEPWSLGFSGTAGATSIPRLLAAVGHSKDCYLRIMNQGIYRDVRRCALKQSICDFTETNNESQSKTIVLLDVWRFSLFGSIIAVMCQKRLRPCFDRKWRKQGRKTCKIGENAVEVYSHSTGNSSVAVACCVSTRSFMRCRLRSIQFVCTHSVLTSKITPDALKRKLSRCLALGF